MNTKGNTSDREKLIQRANKLSEQILNLRLYHFKDEKIIEALSKLNQSLNDIFSIIKSPRVAK